MSDNNIFSIFLMNGGRGVQVSILISTAWKAPKDLHSLIKLNTNISSKNVEFISSMAVVGIISQSC